MTQAEIRQIVERQRAFFRTGATLNVTGRLRALARLKRCIQDREEEIAAALKADLGKSASESWLCETGLVLSELSYMQVHTRAFARERTVRTPLAQFCAWSYRKPSPRGVVLVMSPWNYPFLLTMDPLIDAVAAGDTVVLKPSAYSPHTSQVVREIVEACFPPEHVAVVTGGRAENTSLLEARFDCIFFTGSQEVGREVMRRAAEHLTPVILELGGKSPCIVDRSADLKLAARRIVFGKYLNCGQTCVAPDYVYCDETVKDALLAELKAQIRIQFGDDPLQDPDYGKIVNQKHFDRLEGLMDADKVVWGGGVDRAALQIEPTVMDNVGFGDPVMGEEIFGPILPVLTFHRLDEAIAEIEGRPHPLALYLFTRRRAAAERVMGRCSFGGGCINDVVIHLATSEMGFGGLGESGMGAYHGRAGFDAFSHTKSIVDKAAWIDVPLRYRPYTAGKDKLIRRFLK